MTPQLFYVGLTHQCAPLAVRERIRPDDEKKRAMLARLGGFAAGRMVLSTCERFEVYATTERTDPGEWVALLAHWFHLPVNLLARHVRTLHGVSAADHLLRVASGLESRIVGEAQILGQVRDAYLLANEAKALDAVLSTLGRTAIRTGKRVRHETTINAGSRSIATIAIEWLRRELRETAPDPGRTILILGSGKLAAVVAADVVHRRIGRLIIAGRNAPQVSRLAQNFDARPLALDHLAEGVAEADVVMACASASSFIVDASTIGADRRRPLHVVDLAVPRNIDPEVTRVAGVGLVHLDELVNAGPFAGARGSEGSDFMVCGGLDAAERIVREELNRFEQWRKERDVAPFIAELARRATSVGRTFAEKRALHQQIMRLKAEAAA